MSAGLNKVQLIGNLGADPEVRFSQNGMAICSLRVGVTERRKKGETWEDETEWVRVKTFGKTAENCGQYLQKGRSIYIEGRLKTEKYQDKKTGEDRYSTEVIAEDVKFLGSAPAAGGNAGKSRTQPMTAHDKPRAASAPSRVAGPAPASDGFEDGDLPF